MVVSVLLIIALIMFFLGALPIPMPGNPVAAGLFFWLLSIVISSGVLHR